ncbi:MAG: O-antigen ligase family protein [Dysosmobacter sp.]
MDLKVNAGMPGRVFSIFDNPNTFAQVLLLLLPLVLALFLTAKHWQWKAICAGIFCVGGMAMAMTYSRASWVGLAVAMAVFVFLWKPKLIPAFILLCVLAVPFLPTTVLNRILTITNTADSSTSSRVSLYKAAIEVIRRSPSPERASVLPPPRHTSGNSICTTTRPPLSTPTTFIWRSGSRWACWASPVLWVPCCGTSKTPPERSGIAAPPWGGR